MLIGSTSTLDLIRGKSGRASLINLGRLLFFNDHDAFTNLEIPPVCSRQMFFFGSCSPWSLFIVTMECPALQHCDFG